jgi:hypothetical protein
MKKLLFPVIVWAPLLLLVPSVPAGAARETTVSGYISDSVCGVKGATSSHRDCMNQCLDKGAKPVIVVDDTKQLLIIDNPGAVKGHEGHRVLLTGDIRDGRLHVYSLRII